MRHGRGRRRIGIRITTLRRWWISRMVGIASTHGRWVSPVGRRWWPHHAVGRRWRRWIATVSVRGRRVSRILLLLIGGRRVASTLGGRGNRCVLLVIPANVRNTEFLELAPPHAISLVLASPGSQSIFQKLRLQLGSFALGFAQDAINLCLFFEGSFPRSIVLLVPALVVDFDDLSLLLGPFRLWSRLDRCHPGSVFCGTGPGIGVLA
mmetsp:Transcript_2002/g.4704  ORF Transcript_2002/g.4704 Transcript_2002/m.4704 type:complete len:208 (-) Transcript_2002:1088-1711(-)